MAKPWPVLDLVRPGKQRRLPVVLRICEVQKILQAVQVPLYRICLTTIYSYGLRVGEAVAVATVQMAFECPPLIP